MKRPFALLLMLGAAGCERADEIPPEVIEARHAATRGACVAAELTRRAEDDLRTLEQSLPATAGAGSEMIRRAGGAAFEYARAYFQHAQLRAAAAAQVDSARNFSPTAGDSARHVSAAGKYAIRPPEAGTLEANVYTAYQQEAAALLANADHPCNWDLEETDAPR